MSLEIISQYLKSHKISKPLDYKFTIEQSGVYLIEITARAKNWQQNSAMSFFKDDNLKIEIDKIVFPKLKKRGMFNTPACWNGNQLKDLKKTVVIIIYLEKGQHSCKFIPQQTPFLQYATVYRVTDKEQIVFQPKIHTQAEEGNRRSFYTFTIKDIPFLGFSISASAKQGKQYPTNQQDDDDLQLKINDTIVINNIPKAHKYWYWCGKILEGHSKTFTKNMCFSKDLHYLELFADRSPTLHEVRFFLKRIPMVDDPLWTGDFDDDSEEMILARLIFGEAENQPDEAKIWVASSVLNRVKSKGWIANTIHKVILQEGQYDPFKKTDPNYKKIIDPLNNAAPSTIKAWYCCYEIAEGIISGKIKNPTEATHFHGKGVTRDWFEKKIVPDGRFLKQIGDTHFYWSPN